VYVTIRNYAGGRGFADALVSHQDEIREILTGIDGFRAYYLLRTGEGATTISVFATEDGAPRAAARGEDAAGNRAGQDAEAVCGHERTDAALGEVVRLLEMGQQRSERRVQSGVDHDDHTDEGEQSAHRPRLPGPCGRLPCADRRRLNLTWCSRS